MNAITVYIPPRIRLFAKFEDVEAKSTGFASYFSFDEDVKGLNEQLAYSRTFILAEPGYGKTRLLHEIVTNYGGDGAQAAYIELKRCDPSRSLLSNVEGFAPELGRTLRETRGSHRLVLCLDGLDEVTAADFSRIADGLRDFAGQYPDISLLVACRTHFFKKRRAVLESLGLRYAAILAFSSDEVRDYLKQKDIPSVRIQTIHDLLTSKSGDFVIQTPRYLDLLVRYLTDLAAKGDRIDRITKADLFEHFIYGKLEVEDGRLSQESRDLIKRLLEKLALIMEIYQTNILKKDELMTFFDDIRSDLKHAVLSHIPIQTFYDRSLLKDNVETIEFEVREFQEYLAAKELSRLGHGLQTVFDLAIDSELRDVYPSWFNALTFLVDLEPSLLKPLLDFGTKGPAPDETYHQLLSRSHDDRLPRNELRAVFRDVFIHYQTSLHWIDWGLASNLAYYFDESQEYLLRQYAEKTQFASETERWVQQANAAGLLGFIFDRHILSANAVSYWRERLVGFATDKNENGVLQRMALFSLGRLRDDRLISRVQAAWTHPSQLVRDEFLRFCAETNPSASLALEYFVEGVKRRSLYGRPGLYAARRPEAVLWILDRLISDEGFLETFLDQERVFQKKDNQLLENIERAWNSDIADRLWRVFVTAFQSDRWYQSDDSEFIGSIAKMLSARDRRFVFRLLAELSQSDGLRKHLMGLAGIFALTVEREHVGRFVEDLRRIGEQWTAVAVLRLVRDSGRPGANEIYEEGRPYFTKEYLEADKASARAARNDRRDRVRSQFLFKLEPASGQYDPSVFEFYLANRTTIDPLEDVEKQRLATLVTRSVFALHDPSNAPTTVKVSDGRVTAYNTVSWIPYFGSAIAVAAVLDVDVSAYRRQIIGYIPFAHGTELEAIFKLLGALSDGEAGSLIRVYRERPSEIWRLQPESFIRAAEQFRLAGAVSALRDLVIESQVNPYVRVAALSAVESLRPDVNFLRTLFRRYVRGNEDSKRIAEKANELLIVRHGDDSAIQWRLAELRRRAFKFVEPGGAHPIGGSETELIRREFAAPLTTLRDVKYLKGFLALLGKSFDLVGRDKEYLAYTSYIWETVYRYFDNLKENRSFEPIRELDGYLTRRLRDEGVNWFTGKVSELRRSYLTFIGKPTDVAECVQLYNELKTKQYLRIPGPIALLEWIERIIGTDLRVALEGEGRGLLLRTREPYIQKIINLLLRDAFLRHGFRYNEFVMPREPQLLDDTRTDFLIYYGLVGPIILELKRSSHKDLSGTNLTTKASYRSLRGYMDAYRAHYGVLLVVDDKGRRKGEAWEAHLKRIQQAYEKIPNVKTIGIKLL